MLYYSNFTKRIRHRTSDLMDLLSTHSLRIHQGLPMPFIHDFRDLVHGYTAISLPKDVIASLKEQTEEKGWPFPHNNYTLSNFMSKPLQEYVPVSHLNSHYFDNLVDHINDTMTNLYGALERQHQYVLEVRHHRVMEALKQDQVAQQPPAHKRRKVDITDVCYYESE